VVSLLGIHTSNKGDDLEHDADRSDLDEIDAEGIQRLTEFSLILKRWDEEAKAKGLRMP
jgi:hypothetical protein